MKLIPDSDPTLHTPASPVDTLDQVTPHLEAMFLLMRLNHGIGLAAPQVGIPLRFFVMEYGGLKTVCINPEVINHSEATCVIEEGCLSYPGVRVILSRPEELKLRYLDLNGVVKTPTLRGMKARIAMHELDHLDGVVFTEKQNGIAART